MSALIDCLQHYQQLVLNTVKHEKDELFARQLHPELSPIGWHLGHCIFTENYWVQEKLLTLSAPDDALSALYQPALSNKATRARRLPDKYTLLDWAAHCQPRNLTLLKEAVTANPRDKLMRHDFLIHFLIQHYCQHFETMHMALAYRPVQAGSDRTSLHQPFEASQLSKDSCRVESGNHRIGATRSYSPYDNEYPSHEVQLATYKIGLQPVNNGEYLQFMHDQAYENEHYWSKPGWRWRLKNRIQQPERWREANAGGALRQTDPVSGISYYEAEAYANWAGARLPHEHEWELACKKRVLQAVGRVWEWCANTFFPYQRFKPFPYAGYSQPYFDENHYTLKGGSHLTQAPIKRPSFRNYYPPDKRHQFAGVRLVFD